MAAAVGLSHSRVQRIWHAHGLRPHLVETFKISRDALAPSVLHLKICADFGAVQPAPIRRNAHGSGTSAIRDRRAYSSKHGLMPLGSCRLAAA